MNDSQATVIGNLTADPAITYSADGRAVLQATVATTRRYQTGGEWKEHTSFIRTVAFGQVAENMAQSVHKGDRLICVGRLQTDTYESKTGEKRTDTQLVLEHVGVSLQFATVEVARTMRDARNQHPSTGRHLQTVVADEEPF